MRPVARGQAEERPATQGRVSGDYGREGMRAMTERFLAHEQEELARLRNAAPPKLRRKSKRKGSSRSKRNAENRRRKVYERDGYRCVACGLHESELPEGVTLTLDHIRPVSKGGSNRASNLQTMCKPCNNRKGDS